ncbi:MAG: hypothetical protein AAGH89_02235 [Verrucomicrobiota bacterium]
MTSRLQLGIGCLLLSLAGFIRAQEPTEPQTYYFPEKPRHLTVTLFPDEPDLCMISWLKFWTNDEGEGGILGYRVIVENFFTGLPEKGIVQNTEDSLSYRYFCASIPFARFQHAYGLPPRQVVRMRQQIRNRQAGGSVWFSTAFNTGSYYSELGEPEIIWLNWLYASLDSGEFVVTEWVDPRPLDRSQIPKNQRRVTISDPQQIESFRKAGGRK